MRATEPGDLQHCYFFLTPQGRPNYPVKGKRRSARRGRRKRTIADLSRTKGWHDARRKRGCRGHKGQNDGTAEHNVTLPSCALVKGSRSACIHAPPPGTTLPEIRAPAGPETRACEAPVEGPAHTSSPIRSLHVIVGAGTARAAYAPTHLARLPHLCCARSLEPSRGLHFAKFISFRFVPSLNRGSIHPGDPPC